MDVPDTTQQHTAITQPQTVILDAARNAVIRHGTIWLRWLLIGGLALSLTVAALVLLLHLSFGDLAQLAIWMAVVGLISVGLGEAALRWASSSRPGGLRLKLIIPPLLTALVIVFNTFVIAKLMFISGMDSQILLAILFFGMALALVIAFSIAREMTTAIARIEAGARRISAGEYGERIPIPLAASGQLASDELATLAQSFNVMAANVQDAFKRRDSAENERRQVMAALSHDLRTPLTTVRAMIEAIDDGVVTDPALVRRYQRAIRSELGYLTHLMDDLFELSRLESGALRFDYERMPLAEVVSNVLEGAHEQAEQAGVALTGDVADPLPLVMIDPRQMQRVLTNLVQNALRHTPPGGQVLIALSAQTTERGERQVVTQVIDTGEGISALDLPHIFERMYRANTARQRITPPADTAEALASHEASAMDRRENSSGAGLGLAIARRIIQAHGGSVTAESPTPQATRVLLAQAAGADEVVSPLSSPGTVVRFTLPAAR